MVAGKVLVPYRATVFAMTLLVLLIACSTSALAHARLESSTPISGAALTTMPAEMELSFSEPVVPGSVSLALIGPDGASLLLSDSQVSSDARSVSLTPTAPGAAGTYTLRWSVVSATDGHGTSGLIVFSVGMGIAPPEAFLTSSDRAPWWEIGAEAALLLALAVLAGGMIAGPGGRRWIAPAAGVVAIAAAVITAREAGGWPPESQSGRLRLLVGALAIAARLGGLWRTRSGIALAWGGWTGAIVAVSASGHAAGADRTALAIALASIHAIIARAWAGALIALVIRSRTTPDLELARAISRVAGIGLALLIGAGILSAALHIGGDRALTTSLYGRTLLVKLLVVVLVISLAAANRWVVQPWLGRANGYADGQSRLILAAEAAALAAVIVLAAVLSATSPPGDSTLTNVAPRAIVVEETAQLDELFVSLTGRLAGTPEDELRIDVRDETGSALAGLQRVIVASSYRASDSAPAEPGERVDAKSVAGEPGRYTLPAVHVGRNGLWMLDVIVRRGGATDAVATFTLDTTGRQSPFPRVGAREWSWPVVPAGAWVLLVLAAAVVSVAIWAIRRQGPIAPLSGGIIMIAVAMIATGFAIQALQRTSARTDGHELTMPAETDPVAATSNWQTYCQTCHGEDGRGIESPDPLHQHGDRADLLDRQSRQLADGDLYWLLSRGIGATQMPAYDTALTEQERWDLVAYILQLQEVEGETP